MEYYVEYLSRIGSVSVFAQPSNSSNLTVEKLVQIDGKLLELTYNGGQTLAIPLPVSIPQITNISSCYKVSGGSNQLVVRLPTLLEQHRAKLDRSVNSLMSFNSSYKWNSSYLSKLGHFTLSCNSCDVTLADSDNITQISEMPSELWSEMMDFWHCHKPHDHSNHADHSGEFNERYSSLKPLKNAIITGSYYVAFNSKDDVFQNFQIQQDQTIHCSNCNELIGEIDDKKNSSLDKLFKWNLQLKYGQSSKETFKPHHFIYTTLLDNVNSNATRVIEFSNYSETSKLLIWTFNIGIDFIINDSKGIQKDSLKVYYTTDPKDIEQARKDRGELESITIPDLVFNDTIELLNNINQKLPKDLQKFGKNWKLGLLKMD